MPDAARLTRRVLPTRYDLTVETDADATRFNGEVAIALSVMEPTATIVLHAKELDVTLVELTADGRAVDASLAIDAANERISVTAAEELATGPAALRLRFGAPVSRGLLGYYRSTYTDADGEPRVLAATQFEAPHTRRAFPCFDEPEFKAVFLVTLVVADGLLAISNGPETARESLGDGRVRVTFAPTIPMSTYLVAWVVGPLELTAPVDAGGVQLRVAHVPGKGNLTAFALDIGSFAIRFFADYYGIPYPGEKCDLVALPDFSFGAMENLGCVTFRETRLLLDPEQVTLSEMTDAALTIVHEIAHMWFGDLVTMRWWNGIWLNEAFATFMERLGVDAYREAWRAWDDFALGRAVALDTDALSNTRTVEYPVHTPEDADGMFDVLTYQKGGSVLRMLERWLGADAFRAGVRAYLDRYRLANTETTDLWDSLEEATGQPVRKIMDTWIFQPGFPLVTPHRDGDRVTLSQQRFSYVGGASPERWSIPVRARVESDGWSETRSLLLADADVTTEVPAGARVVLDAGGEGFYRVAYPAEWRAELLASGALRPLERFSIVDDTWAAVLAGVTPADEVLALARQLRDEDDLVVWRLLISVLRGVARVVDGEALVALWGEIGLVLEPAAERLGRQPAAGDDARTRQLRGIVLDALGTLVEDPRVVASARETYAAPGVDPDVAAASVAIVAAAGDAATFDDYIARADAAATPQEQLRFLYALGTFPTEELVLRTVDLALSDAVRPQNGPFLIQRALRNRRHGPAAWVQVRDRWTEVRDRFSSSLVSRLLDGITWLVDDASMADVPRFLEANPVPEGARVIAQHLERQRVHRAVVDRERDRLSAALLRAQQNARVTNDNTAVDRVLSTTRSVRKRLDLSRPVEREVVLECLRLAIYAPTGGNTQGWRWVVVDDPQQRAELAALYRRRADPYLGGWRNVGAADQPNAVLDSSEYLAAHMHEVPVLVVPCLLGRLPDPPSTEDTAGFFGSILPAVWNFQLALRSRGLGSCFTTLHLAYEREAAELLGIPDTVTQAALIPVAYTKGDEFKPAVRRPVEEITYWNRWKQTS